VTIAHFVFGKSSSTAHALSRDGAVHFPAAGEAIWADRAAL